MAIDRAAVYPVQLLGRVMRTSVPGSKSMRGHTTVIRLALLLGLGLALGACSKCDVPDFTHWHSSSSPHVCDSDAPQQ
jgi:hypothetical protein